MPRRRIESSNLQSDSFVITGMQGLKKMVVRGYAKNGEVRGITIMYDQAMEADRRSAGRAGHERVRAVPVGLRRGGRADAPRRKVEYGTGVFVSAVGHVVTDRNLVDVATSSRCRASATPSASPPTSAANWRCSRVYGARGLTPAGA